MKDLLVILNPRRIPAAMAAFNELPIDKLWVRSMTEWEVAQRWDEVLALASGYDTLIVASDDGLVRPHALEEVRRQHAYDARGSVVTGYSNLSATDWRANVTKSETADRPAEDAYELYTVKEIMESETALVRSYFTGMCLTTMSYELWQRFPFTVFDHPPGNASDFMLSKALVRAGIEIWVARDAFVWHMKEVWNAPDKAEEKRLYVEEPGHLIFERA